jgi:hypothetical protein
MTARIWAALIGCLYLLAFVGLLLGRLGGYPLCMAVCLHFAFWAIQPLR